jgi:hypothetical protein
MEIDILLNDRSVSLGNDDGQNDWLVEMFASDSLLLPIDEKFSCSNADGKEVHKNDWSENPRSERRMNEANGCEDDACKANSNEHGSSWLHCGRGEGGAERKYTDACETGARTEINPTTNPRHDINGLRKNIKNICRPALS